MSTTRDLGAVIPTLILRKVVKPAVFIYADIPAAPMRIWSGKGTYIDGTTSHNSWLGVGKLLNIDALSETVDSGAVGLRIQLNGIDPDVRSVLLTPYQGHLAQILLAFWNDDDGSLNFLPSPFWQGTVDTDDLATDSKGSTLALFFESRERDILRKRNILYTDAAQQAMYPGQGDTGLSHINSIQDLSIPWGRTQSGAAASPSNGLTFG